MAGVGLSGSIDGLLRYDLKGDSIARAMALAAQDPSIVDYISSAANSTPDLDRTETLQSKRSLRKGQKKFLSAASNQCLGVRRLGGIRACGVALSLDQGMIPPTIWNRTSRPSMWSGLYLRQSRKREIRSALLNGCSNGDRIFRSGLNAMDHLDYLSQGSMRNWQIVLIGYNAFRNCEGDRVMKTYLSLDQQGRSGSELTVELRKRYGSSQVVAGIHKTPPQRSCLNLAHRNSEGHDKTSSLQLSKNIRLTRFTTGRSPFGCWEANLLSLDVGTMAF